jgi:hypothetical protein
VESLLDHIQTVAEGRIGPLIATLSRRRMDEACQALAFALSCGRPTAF